MFNHTIFDLLKTFSAEEKTKFYNFISSPYFNKNTKVITLYNELKKYYPLFINAELSKENLGKILCPQNTYNFSNIHDLFYKLQKLVLGFLVQERFNNSKPLRDDYLLKQLSYRNQNRLFIRYTKRIENHLNNESFISPEYLYNLYVLELNKINFGFLNSKTLKKEKAYDEIKALSDNSLNYVIYFITEMIDQYLKLYFKSYNYNIDCSENYYCKFIDDINFDDIIKKYFKRITYVTVLELYNAMYKTFRYFINDEYYIEYKDLLSRYNKEYSSDEKMVHYANLINYCIMKISSMIKKDWFQNDLMSLYEVVLRKRYFITTKVNHLKQELFRDILFLALKLKNPRWLLRYLKVYCDMLHPSNKECMSNFGYAYFYNVIRDFEKSQDYINKVSLDHFTYKYDMKNLRLKNLYELNYLEEVLNLIHSYRENLRYSRMFSEGRKMCYRNFLMYLEKTAHAKMGRKGDDIGFIKSKLQKTDQVFFKEWMLDKIGEIEKGLVHVA